MISPSTHTEPQFATKPRIVSFRREIDVGVSGDESRGCTESGGGAWPGAGSKVVIAASPAGGRTRTGPSPSESSLESEA